jgi:hypothetical protein
LRSPQTITTIIHFFDLNLSDELGFSIEGKEIVFPISISPGGPGEVDVFWMIRKFLRNASCPCIIKCSTQRLEVEKDGYKGKYPLNCTIRLYKYPL